MKDDHDRLVIIKTQDGEEHTFIMKKKMAKAFGKELQRDIPEGISDMEHGK